MTHELPLTEISANPDNPRETLGDISGMADSLTEIGQIQFITVASVEAYLRDRPERATELEPGANFVVVDGHRRLAGARAAGLSTIKVTVDDARVTTDEALLESAFVANAQRRTSPTLEEAAALKTLVASMNPQHKAARRLGVTQPYIYSDCPSWNWHRNSRPTWKQGAAGGLRGTYAASPSTPRRNNAKSQTRELSKQKRRSNSGTSPRLAPRLITP
ncbi:hypothetical protein STENM223S_09996 [Streptomyces tendae]